MDRVLSKVVADSLGVAKLEEYVDWTEVDVPSELVPSADVAVDNVEDVTPGEPLVVAKAVLLLETVVCTELSASEEVVPTVLVVSVELVLRVELVDATRVVVPSVFELPATVLAPSVVLNSVVEELGVLATVELVVEGGLVIADEILDALVLARLNIVAELLLASVDAVPLEEELRELDIDT